MAHVFYGQHYVYVTTDEQALVCDKSDYPSVCGDKLTAEEKTAWSANWTTWHAFEQSMIDAGKMTKSIVNETTIDGVTHPTITTKKLVFTDAAAKDEYMTYFEGDVNHTAQCQTLEDDTDVHFYYGRLVEE